MRTTTIIAIFCLLCVVQGWNLKVMNNVKPCSNENYVATIKLFYGNNQQENINLGNSVALDSSLIPSLGLGIQENGEYCRCCGNEAGCNNPDNAGMELVVNEGNCGSFQLNDPFYCGKHPPNAKTIVNVELSGAWPNCVANLSRLDNAPSCQSSC